MERNDILERAAQLFEAGMPLSVTTLASTPDNGSTCAACALGALIIASGVECLVIATAVEQDPYYDLCYQDERSTTPLQEAVMATATAVSGSVQTGRNNIVATVYSWSDTIAYADPRNTGPVIDAFRRAKELP